MIALGILSQGFRAVSGGADGAAAIFGFANNPLVGVLLGILATAVVQSSSAVTSVIVGLVDDGLPVALAVPMITGSKMGTTVTNTLAALGNFREDQAFNRSFAAATVHDLFNLFTVFGAQALFNDRSPEVMEAEANTAVYEAVQQEVEAKRIEIE